jgi:hypothetical protein
MCLSYSVQREQLGQSVDHVLRADYLNAPTTVSGRPQNIITIPLTMHFYDSLKQHDELSPTITQLSL